MKDHDITSKTINKFSIIFPYSSPTYLISALYYSTLNQTFGLYLPLNIANNLHQHSMLYSTFLMNSYSDPHHLLLVLPCP